ncbi:hypothetical protein DVH24_014071 [Malus domestica]|uniref:RNA-dependent RNA polymerase 6-like RNA-binding domain-containing protein n=1 Tax=Malus domestica TaxID=3750 RepID=A0A498JF74_MALDO|nr:hypothetical protein DVH24_014071 [Malus domestica]
MCLDPVLHHQHVALKSLDDSGDERNFHDIKMMTKAYAIAISEEYSALGRNCMDWLFDLLIEFGALMVEKMEYEAVTQLCIGGFGRHVKLENNIGSVGRWLKTSWTLEDSFPDVSIINTSSILERNVYVMVEPHAFVHFIIPDSVKYAMDAARRSQLFYNNKPWKVILGSENQYFKDQKYMPVMISDVLFEIGNLPNLIPTNTETFCDKTSHLKDCAGGNYQVGDNIGVVGNGLYDPFL